MEAQKITIDLAKWAWFIAVILLAAFGRVDWLVVLLIVLYDFRLRVEFALK